MQSPPRLRRTDNPLTPADEPRAAEPSSEDRLTAAITTVATVVGLLIIALVVLL